MTEPQKFLREHISEEDADSGIMWSSIAGAIQTWCGMNYGGERTVAEAARVFNTSPDVIHEAVEYGYWMFLTGPDDQPEKQIIELEGL